MLKFRESTFYQSVLSHESDNEDEIKLRYGMVIITTILTTFTVLYVFVYITLCKRNNRFCSNFFRRNNYTAINNNNVNQSINSNNYILDANENRNFYWILLVVLLINLLMHNGHYVHNILNPVVYHEPEWLYSKYLFSSMELTFSFNFPVFIVYLIGAHKMLLATYSKNTINMNSNLYNIDFITGRVYLFIYILLSLVTFGHYLTELPTNFGLIPNFTIAGESIAAISLGFLLWKFDSQLTSNTPANNNIVNSNQMTHNNSIGTSTKVRHIIDNTIPANTTANNGHSNSSSEESI